MSAIDYKATPAVVRYDAPTGEAEPTVTLFTNIRIDPVTNVVTADYETVVKGTLELPPLEQDENDPAYVTTTRMPAVPGGLSYDNGYDAVQELIAAVVKEN